MTGWSTTSPLGSKIVVEPVVPDQWAMDIGNPSPVVPNGNRWIKYPTSRSQIDPRNGARLPPPGIVVNIEDFERILRPELVDLYEERGYCWVVDRLHPARPCGGPARRGSRGPRLLRRAGATGRVVYEASPYTEGKGPVGFNFDWTFDYYPLAYHRPGPVMTIYRLQSGQCTVVAVRGRGVHLHEGRPTSTSRGRSSSPATGWAGCSPNPVVGAVIVRDGRSWARAGTTSTADRTPRSTRSPPRRAPTCAGSHALRLDGALLPSRQDAALHRRDRRRGHQPRGRRLRRPQRQGGWPRAGHPARRGHRGRRSPTASSPPAPGSPTRPSASSRAPAARGCCSSRR